MAFSKAHATRTQKEMRVPKTLQSYIGEGKPLPPLYGKTPSMPREVS